MLYGVRNEIRTRTERTILMDMLMDFVDKPYKMFMPE
jgi:hypothetical protein